MKNAQDLRLAEKGEAILGAHEATILIAIDAECGFVQLIANRQVND